MQEVQPIGFRISMRDTQGFDDSRTDDTTITIKSNGMALSFPVFTGNSHAFRASVIQSLANEQNGHPAIHFGIVCEGTVEFAGQLFSHMCFDWHADGNFLTIGNREYIMEAMCGMTRQGRASRECRLDPISSLTEEEKSWVRAVLRVSLEEWAILN
jgi:hypothetical protein